MKVSFKIIYLSYPDRHFSKSVLKCSKVWQYIKRCLEYPISSQKANEQTVNPSKFRISQHRMENNKKNKTIVNW